MERRALWMAEDAARELPDLPLEDALQLVHLYAERGSPKFEKAVLRWLERCLTEARQATALRGDTASLAKRARGVTDPAVLTIRLAAVTAGQAFEREQPPAWFVRRQSKSVARALHLLRTSASLSLLCRRARELLADRGAGARRDGRAGTRPLGSP